MNPLTTERLILIETAFIRPSMIGPIRCVCINAWDRRDPVPSLLTASALLADMRGGWVLSHLLIEDEERRQGFATEIVRFYEDRLGPLGACWASAAGAAFARRYVERFGPRPHWLIGTDPRLDLVMQQIATKHRTEETP